ncbi:alcohol dehydrogenase catalytic domain-containing protein [Streptomyces sp. NBC_00390]|uniref:alcohol dehydrogenase catalytic domain-containing protein n=1 Tax=Streptomyces sp. NBC_00390 TaxID=2975736 RepID=UPI003FCE8F46
MPVPEPGPGQVLVKVGGAGACHSDLHIMEASGPPPGFATELPFTLGHENAGWVERLGPGVTGFAPGDPVMVYGPWGCGACANWLRCTHGCGGDRAAVGSVLAPGIMSGLRAHGVPVATRPSRRAGVPGPPSSGHAALAVVAAQRARRASPAARWLLCGRPAEALRCAAW